ncbi:hypothetical protein ACMDCT_05050 [Halomonadaceae bacterium KBTZ08]
MKNVRLSNILWLAILYVVLFNLLSAVAITFDIWLGIKDQLGGNAAVTVISCIIVAKLSQGGRFSSKRNISLFTAVAGLSAVVFLVFLRIASQIMDGYEVSAITLGEAVAVFAFNGGLFIGTAFFMERGSNKKTDYH